MLANLNNSLDFNLPQLFQLAEALMHARGFVPSHITHPGAVVAAILTGRELGVPPMAALRGIKFVDGSPVFDASLHLGIMIARGVKYRWLSDGSDGIGHLWLQRPGQEPFDSVFTMEMAKKAQLTNKQNWQKYPAAMLRARAVSAASRAYMPDVLSGCFVPGELEADRDESPPNTSMAPASLDGAGQGERVVHTSARGDVAVATHAALPAQTENAAPLELPARIVRDYYAIADAKQLAALNDEARLSWPQFKKDEKLAIVTARDWAAARLLEIERDRADAAAADAALSARADAAIGGEGGPPDDGDDRSGQTGNPADAAEPGANDVPDVEAPHEPDAGFGGSGVVQQ